MRYNGSRKVLFGLMICVASVALWSNCSAAEKFVGWHEDGVFYRFDNETGEIHKLVKNQSGTPAWVRCEVKDMTATAKASQKSQPLPTAAPSTQTAQPQNAVANCVPPIHSQQPVQILDVGMNSLSPDSSAPKVASASKGRIMVWNENDKDITDTIDDAERSKCRPEINAYDALNVSHTLKTSGDRIKGIISISNKGNRKIDLLELTMTVRIIGKEKPENYKRYILAEGRPGCEKPPAPSLGGTSLSVMQSVDLPMPSGVLNGMPEVKVTCIRFGDRE